MIKYALVCEHEHAFEAWFSNSSDFDDQARKGYVVCPLCGTDSVEKAIMAPNISTSRKKEASAQKQSDMLKVMNEAAEKIRQDIETNCDYVGEKFVDEARAIHYGEKPERAIYGEASLKDAKDLRDEGVSVSPLPEFLSPKAKKQLN